MSNIINAYIDEKSILNVEQSEGFSGEHNAEIIEIDLGSFANETYDYYILNFSNARIAGKHVSNEIRTENDTPAYISGQKIYCPLSNALTCTGRLKIQLEAHKSGEGEELIKKSSVAELRFKPSIMGIEDMLSVDSPSLIRLIQLEKRLGELETLHGIEINEINEKFEDVSDRFGEAGTEVDSKIAALEKLHGQELDSLEEKIDSKISKEAEKHSDDMETVNSELEKLRVIPFADENVCGGFMLDYNSVLRVKDGYPVFDLSKVNLYRAYHFMATVALAEKEYQNVIYFETVEEANGFLENNYMDVIDGSCEYYIVSVADKGVITYFDEMEEPCDVDVPIFSINAVWLDGGKVRFKTYTSSDFRNLITEGVKLE